MIHSPRLVSAQIWSAVSRFLRWREAELDGSEPTSSHSMNVEDEYLKACRSESYVEFASRVAVARSINTSGGSTCSLSQSLEPVITTLLEPGEEQVQAILKVNNHLENFELLSDYFDVSKKWCTLCTLLLKRIEKCRDWCRGVRRILECNTAGTSSRGSDREILEQMLEEENKSGLFSGLVAEQFDPVHDRYLNMQKQLEKVRKKTRANLRQARRLLKACTMVLSAGCFILLLVTTLAVFLAVASLVLGCRVFTFPIDYVVRRVNRRRKSRIAAMERQWRQIEAVSQGTFVVFQDVGTMKRLVSRLSSEIDSSNRTVEFLNRHRDDALLLRQSLQRLSRNQTVMNELLDDLEQNICLSFLSINKARALVVRELCL